MDHEGRFLQIQNRMIAEGLDLVLISDPANVRYLSGYWSILPDVGLIICQTGEPILVVPYLELGLAEATSWVSDRRYLRGYSLSVAGTHQEGQTILGELRSHLASSGLIGSGVLGLELGHLTANQLAEIRADIDLEIRDISSWVPGLRLLKDQNELDLLRQSARVADMAAAAAIQAVRPGVTEATAAAAAVEAIWRAGARATHIVLGAGPRSAFPHPLPTPSVLQGGQLVVMDFGICFGGYWTEIARTVVVGGCPSPQQQAWFDLVQAAQRAAEAGLRPGRTAGQVDQLAREVYLRAGYDGRAFTHSLGHGDGLLGADPPYIRPLDEDPLQAGMVISLEPGLYFPGMGGIRLEDTFYVGGAATERWTRTDQSLAGLV